VKWSIEEENIHAKVVANHLTKSQLQNVNDDLGIDLAFS
jgi:hypothetical protein